MHAFEKIVIFSLTVLGLVQFKMAVSLQHVDSIREDLDNASGWR